MSLRIVKDGSKHHVYGVGDHRLSTHDSHEAALAAIGRLQMPHGEGKSAGKQTTQGGEQSVRDNIRRGENEPGRAEHTGFGGTAHGGYAGPKGGGPDDEQEDE